MQTEAVHPASLVFTSSTNGTVMACALRDTHAQHLPPTNGRVGWGLLCVSMCEWLGPWPTTYCTDSAPRWPTLPSAWRGASCTLCGDCCPAMMMYYHQSAALNHKVTQFGRTEENHGMDYELVRIL